MSERRNHEDRPLRGIAESLDHLLGKSATQWTQREIDIYHLLKLVLEKHKVKYTMAQFRLDVQDIRRNIMELDWYQASKFKKVLNWLMRQISIKSYQHSKANGHFKVVVRFTDVGVKMTILKKNGMFFKFEREASGHVSERLDSSVLEFFGIEVKGEEKKLELIKDLRELFVEIGYFYQG